MSDDDVLYGEEDIATAEDMLWIAFNDCTDKDKQRNYVEGAKAHIMLAEFKRGRKR